MAFIGVGEILVLLALSGGVSNDLASLVNAEDYFKARNIDIKVEKMVELVGNQPADAKASFGQLLAIRWLGQHAAEAKKDKKARDLLQQIADGKKAQDPQGFSRFYAQRTLAQLDGKPVPAPELPQNSLKEEGALWFPEQCNFYGGFDLRSSGPAKPEEEARLHDRFWKMVPDPGKEQVYKFGESVGNVRIDRFTGAFLPDAKEHKKSRIYLRLTGKADPERFAAFMSREMIGRRDPNQQGAQIKREKGPKGESILVISAEKRPPVIALIGDTDFIIAGCEGDDEDHRAVLQQVLEVRAGKQLNLTTGPLGGSLRRAPAGAFALVMGDPPAEMRRDFTRGNSPLKVLPQTSTLYATRNKGLTIGFEAKMSKPEEAKEFAAAVGQLKQMGIDGLKQIPDELKIKTESIEQFRKALGSIQVKAEGTTVKGGAEVPGSALEALQELFEKFIDHNRPRTAPPPP
jgi:hypothetical protein